MSRGAKVLPEGAAAANVANLQRLYRTPTTGSGCVVCRGTGTITDRGGQKQTCPRCKGTGRP